MNKLPEYTHVRKIELSRFAKNMKRFGNWKAVSTDIWNCPKHGQFQCTTWQNETGLRAGVICDQCDQELKAEETSQLMKKACFAYKRIEIGLPDDLVSVTFDDLTPRDEAERMACEWGRGFSQQYRNLCVMGRTGPGKSWLAGAIVNDCLVNRKSVMYATEDTIMNRFKASFVKWPERTEQEITDELISKAVLVIDEIGQGDKSDWRRRKLYEIISERISKCRSTVCISNRTPEEFRAYLGDPIISRLRISGKFITYTGSDRRGEPR
ncbi:MAG: ATP-binding protein [Sphaerochaetaceae bacterium]|jgi:DNA replication protein DnaC